MHSFASFAMKGSGAPSTRERAVTSGHDPVSIIGYPIDPSTIVYTSTGYSWTRRDPSSGEESECGSPSPFELSELPSVVIPHGGRSGYHHEITFSRKGDAVGSTGISAFVVTLGLRGAVLLGRALYESERVVVCENMIPCRSQSEVVDRVSDFISSTGPDHAIVLCDARLPKGFVNPVSANESISRQCPGSPVAKTTFRMGWTPPAAAAFIDRIRSSFSRADLSGVTEIERVEALALGYSCVREKRSQVPVRSILPMSLALYECLKAASSRDFRGGPPPVIGVSVYASGGLAAVSSSTMLYLGMRGQDGVETVLRGMAKTRQGRRALSEMLSSPMRRTEDIERRLSEVESADLSLWDSVKEASDLEGAASSFSATSLGRLEACLVHCRALGKALGAEGPLIEMEALASEARGNLDPSRISRKHPVPLAAGSDLWDEPLRIASKAFDAVDTVGSYKSTRTLYEQERVDSIRASAARMFEISFSEVSEGLRSGPWPYLCERLALMDANMACRAYADKHRHVRPSLVGDDGPAIYIRGGRHPVLERDSSDSLFVPVDLPGDSSAPCTLVFGENGSGKSTYLRTVGLCVLMAQCGMFVPCSSMELRPFSHLVAVHRPGEGASDGSSYCSEIRNLSDAFRRSSPRSMVLMDEPARSTDIESSEAMVHASVNELVSKGCVALVATHHHGLPERSGVGEVHFRSTYDPSTGGRMFDRTLRSGRGPGFYGSQTAKESGLFGGRFVSDLEGFSLSRKRKEPEKSRYSSRVPMGACGICGGRASETHHIVARSRLGEGALALGGSRVNAPSNLMPMCESCHDSAHLSGHQSSLRKFARVGGGYVFSPL